MTNAIKKERRNSQSGGRDRWGERTLMVALILGPMLLWGQNPAATPSKPVEGTKIYAERCAGCHGADAHGTDHGPGLTGSPTLRKSSIAQLHNFILNGIPSLGMPAFDLPSGELDALAALVHSLNASAAEKAVPGDSAAGEQFFFAKGQCASCHMVCGRGGPNGPDLSNIAREMTADEIREALLQPSARITPGYELVTVRLRDGKTRQGFARDRSNFDIQLQDLNGRFHMLQEGQISAIQEEKQSLMPPVKPARKCQPPILPRPGPQQLGYGVDKGSALDRVEKTAVPGRVFQHLQPRAIRVALGTED